MAEDVGTIISKMNQPSPSFISFVVTSSIVRTGQFVEVDFQDGTLIALVNDVYKTNKYFENADSVKQFEASGTKLFEQFPTQEWEYLVADAKPLGVFTKEGIKRPSFPVAPGMKVRIATNLNLKKFIGFDDVQGLHLGKLEFHDVDVRLNLSRLFQKHLAILAMSGSGKCVKGNTMVLLEGEEQKTIAEIVDTVLNKNKKIEDGIESWEENSNLFAYGLKDGKIAKTQIKGFYRRKAPELISISTRSGKSIEVTPEHSVPVFRGNIEWIQAKNLTLDDYVFQPRIQWVGKESVIHAEKLIKKYKHLLVENGFARARNSKKLMPLEWKVDEGFAELMAYWLAEGHNTAKIRFDFTNSNGHLKKNYAKLLLEKFNLVPTKVKNRDQFYVDHAVLAKTLHQVGFTNSSWTKFIPSEILSSKREVLLAFLAAFIDCDGHVNPSKSEIEITLAGKELSKGIGEILTKLGVIYASKKKLAMGREYQRIFVTGSNELRKLKDLNLRVEHKKAALEKWANTKGNPNVDVIPNLHDHFENVLKLLRMPQPQHASSGITNYLNRKDNPSHASLQVLIGCFENRLEEVEKAIQDAIVLENSVPQVDEFEALEIVSSAYSNGLQFKQIAQGSGVSSTTARRVVRNLTAPKQSVFLLANNALKLQNQSSPVIEQAAAFNGNACLNEIKRLSEVFHFSTEQLCRNTENYTGFLYHHSTTESQVDQSNLLKIVRVFMDQVKEIQENIILARNEIGILKQILQLNVFFDRITGIETKQYDGYVYDLSTDAASFIANKILIHNSHSISVLLEELLLRKKESGRIGIVLFDVHGEYTSFALPPEKTNSPYLDFSSQTRMVKGGDVRIAVSKTDSRGFHAMLPGISSAQLRELQIVLNKLHHAMMEGSGPFGLDDIKRELLKTVTDGKGRENVISPLSAWLNELDNLHLFAKTDNPSIPDLIRPGTLTIVDLSDLIDAKRKQLIVAHFARKLFHDRRNKKIPPVLLVLEEAHQFIPQWAQKGEAISKGPLATIAREGRKFGCSLCLISQRPVHLDTTVLSQCNSNLFLRITNPNDLKHIGESSEGIDEKSLRLITSLKVGDALLVGEAVNFPVFFRVRDRKTLKSRHEKSLEDSAKEFEAEKSEALKEAESFL